MNDIRYEVDGNIVLARFKKPWADKFNAEMLKLGLFPPKLKEFLLYMNYDECGKAKCHPDDKFSHDIGWHIAKNRLLDKYLRIRARIARRIGEAVYKDYYKLGKIGKKDRKKGW